MKILNKNEIKNDLLSRTEIKTQISFEGVTPSKKEVKSLLVKEFGTDENLFVIKEIIVGHGSSTASIESFIYSDLVSKERIESLTMHKKIKEKLDEEKKKEEEAKAELAKKAEESASEKSTEPVEQVKEE